MKKFTKKMQKIKLKYLTDSGAKAVFSETREMETSPSRDMETVNN